MTFDVKPVSTLHRLRHQISFEDSGGFSHSDDVEYIAPDTMSPLDPDELDDRGACQYRRR